MLLPEFRAESKDPTYFAEFSTQNMVSVFDGAQAYPLIYFIYSVCLTRLLS